MGRFSILRHDTHKVMRRFVEGRPLSDIIIQFLDWLCCDVEREGKKVLIVVWDDALWHTAGSASTWVYDHNQWAKHVGGVEIDTCELSVASPG